MSTPPWPRAFDEPSRLDVALDPRAMEVHLAPLGRSPRAPSSRSASVCQILDVKYDPGAGCAVLYRVDDRLVLGLLGSAGAGAAPTAGLLIAPLDMRAYAFPDDPGLPGLAAVFDPDTARTVLAEVLPACRAGGSIILRCRPELVRYRPLRRCTVRLTIWLRDRVAGTMSRRVHYAKLYHDGAKARSVYDELQQLQSAEVLRAGGVAVPPPVAFVPELSMVLLDPLAGTALDMLFEGGDGRPVSRGRPGVEAARRAAAALASLHGADVETARQRAAAWMVEKLTLRAAKVALVDAALGREVSALAAALTSSLERLEQLGAETSLVHGDCKPSQFLIGPDQVGILDFDRCGIGDPACDLGDFLADLQQLDTGRSITARSSKRSPGVAHPLRSLGECFLDEYCGRREKEADFRSRVGWYETAALLRKAYRSFQRSPRSPLPLALVRGAWSCLDSLSPRPVPRSFAVRMPNGRRAR